MSKKIWKIIRDDRLYQSSEYGKIQTVLLRCRSFTLFAEATPKIYPA